MNWVAEYEKAARVKAALGKGDHLVGGLLSLADPTICEIFATAGFDFLIIDEEHSAHSRETVRAMLQACTGTGATPFVRPGSLDRDEVRRLLDLGAFGIVLPLVESADQAADLVSACRYPPLGTRSFGPIRASGFFTRTEEYLSAAAHSIVVMPMIESAAGIEAVEEITAVEGVDAICVGPSDLSMSLGCRGEMDNPIYLEAIERIRSACAANGVAFGAGAYNAEHAKAMLDSEMQFAIAAADDGLLIAGAVDAVATIRE